MQYDLIKSALTAMYRSSAAALVVCIWSSSASAAESQIPADDCHHYEVIWSPTEQSAWNKICAGQQAPVSNVTSSSMIGGLPSPERNAASVTATFVKTILTQSPYRQHVEHLGVKINGAVFKEVLDLSELNIQGLLSLTNCQFDKKVDISRSHFTNSISFAGSTLTEGIAARDAHIGGTLVLGGSDDAGPRPNAPYTKVTIGSIDGGGIHVQGNLEIADADIMDGTKFFGAHIGGTVALFRLVAHEIGLGASDIHGQLDIVDSDLTSTQQQIAELGPGYALLNLYSVHVSQGVFLVRTTVRGITLIEQADIGGSLILLGAHLAKVQLRGASIRNSLSVGHNERPGGRPGIDTLWFDDAVLDLSSATIGAIYTPLSVKYWPRSVIFNNLDVGALSFNVVSASGEKLDNDVDWLAKWMDLQKGFTSERYFRTRVTLQKTGNEVAAAGLGYVSRDRELADSFRRGDMVHAAYLAFSKIIIGYGYQMWLPIVWAIVFLGLGAAIFRRTTEAKLANMPYGIAYSFDMLLPLIKLRDYHYKIDLIKPSVRYYFYLHKIAGWVIGSFILAGLSGFTK
jgi:hypothetical protein